jgi:hypothetical protein
VAQEVLGYNEQASREKTMKIYDTIWDIAERSDKLGSPTYRVADLFGGSGLPYGGVHGFECDPLHPGFDRAS